MLSEDVKQKVFTALSLLKVGRRDEAAEQLREAIARGPATGELWRSIGRLAAEIGEIDLAVEAVRRFASTPPVKLSRKLEYWKELITFGRSELVEEEIALLGAQIREHPAVLHVQGQLAAQKGEFEAATRLHLQVVKDPEFAAQGWFSISTINDMSRHPEWIDQMLAVERENRTDDASGPSRLLYGLGKAFHDCREYARAMDCYSRGAAARKNEAEYNPGKLESFAVKLVREFNPQAMSSLTEPVEKPRASIFVNGLPRSGTTLVEQILVANSAVEDGGEVNLARAALKPVIEYSFTGALNYQRECSDLDDPWGVIGHQYERMLRMRFRTSSLVVDKSLTQSLIMGLIKHAMPACPVIWMRRDTADVAISCYRTLFTSPLAWCWTFKDMGHFFAVEDALFNHWRGLFGERILVMDYQELVKQPRSSIEAIARHAGLESEESMHRFHENKRAVRTASLQQVRKPITTAAVGQSAPYAPWMGDFWRSYDEASTRIAAALGSGR